MKWKEIFISIYEQNGCDDKHEDVWEEVTTVKKLYVKGTLRGISQHGKQKGWNVGSWSQTWKENGNLPRHKEDAHSMS